MMGLTARQTEVLNFIKSYANDHDGVCPSQREIARHFKNSPNIVNGIIARLEERGAIIRMPGRSRAIQIIKDHCPRCGGEL